LLWILILGGLYLLVVNKRQNRSNGKQVVQNSDSSALLSPTINPDNLIEMLGMSMYPNYLDNAYYSVDRESYVNTDPQRGDVVIVERSDDNNSVLFFVKRIIGLPGETIMISNGKVYINSVLLSEPYLSQEAKTELWPGSLIQESQTLTIPSGQFFVMGDNRAHSSDSREWNFIPKEQIIAKVLSCAINCSPDHVRKTEEDYTKGEVVVSFEENTRLDQAKELFSRFGIVEYENYPWKSKYKNTDYGAILNSWNQFILKVGPGSEDEMIAKLLGELIVRGASKNYTRPFDVDLDRDIEDLVQNIEQKITLLQSLIDMPIKACKESYPKSEELRRSYCFSIGKEKVCRLSDLRGHDLREFNTKMEEMISECVKSQDEQGN